LDALAAISEHSAGLAAAARDNLEARVEHCPEWDVADLVHHVTDVHWFWTTIAAEALDAPPDESLRPGRVPDRDLVDTFLAGAERMVAVLRDADQSAAVWTWAPAQRDIAFITRHQVQEAAVHHWDAVNATGGQLAFDPAVASDAIAEFLSFSVSSDADPADPPRPSLDGRLVLRCDDLDESWTVEDGAAPGTVAFRLGTHGDAPSLVATASGLLLWLCRRVEIDTGECPTELIGRFRDLCFTD
jgi:uncharacterized protein (TIGR03083 family)